MWNIVKGRLKNKSFWILLLPIICMFLVDIGLLKSPEILDEYFYKIWSALAFLGIVTNTTSDEPKKVSEQPSSILESEIDDIENISDEE